MANVNEMINTTTTNIDTSNTSVLPLVENKKYKMLTENSIEISPEITVYQIIALCDIETRHGVVKTGTLGGHIQGYHNLSQEGNCWIFLGAMAFEKAEVSGNAILMDRARASGCALVCDYVGLYDDAHVTDNAELYDRSKVSGKGSIHGDVRLHDYAHVTDIAEVGGEVILRDKVTICSNAYVSCIGEISGTTEIGGDALISDINEELNFYVDIKSNNDVLFISGIIESSDITCYRTYDDTIIVNYEIFNDDISKFELYLKDLTENDENIKSKVELLLKLIHLHFNRV